MSERTIKTLGVVVTVLLHLGLGTAIALIDTDPDDDERTQLRDMDDAEVIEASLAYKSDKPKRRQPQKKKKLKVAPPKQVGVVSDINAKPVERKQDPPPDMIDPEAVLNKHRNVVLDEEGAETGSEDPLEGSPDGSKWGTATEATGDPYVGELHGRIKKVWEIPTLETGAGVALGCVRLDADGKIIERVLWKKSGITNLDRSVEEALRTASDMEEPVPAHLIFKLTRTGICFRFKLDG